MNKNFIIGIVLYKPSVNSINRIYNIASQKKYKFIIYDNSGYINIKLSNCPNIIYCISSNNIGLTGALNFIIQEAISLGYDYLLNFDQDTIFSVDTLFFVNDVLFLEEIFDDSLICISFRDFKKINSPYLISNDTIYYYNFIDFSINSGSLFFLKYYESFTWFNKDFFVDGVDYNFNINADKYGYKFIEFYNTPDLNHKSEQDDITIDFFLFKLTGRKYSYIRNYDFLRSHLKLLYKTFFNFQPKHFYFILKSITLYCLSQVLFIFHKVFKYYS